MGYQSTTQGGDYNQQTTNLPGTKPGTPPSGLPAEWKNATVVTEAARPSKSVGEQARTRMVDFGTPAKLTTASQMLLDFDTAQSDPTAVEQLQTMLWQAGFYGDDKTPKFTPGEKDDYTRNAFIQAVKEASRARQPFGDFLDERVSARTKAMASGLLGTGRAPFSPVVSNPADVRQTLQLAAQKVLGQDLPPDKVQQLVAAFQAQQTSAQKASYDTTATGGSSVAAPDMSSFAMDAAKSADPVKADARSAVRVAGVIQKMMSGGV